MFKIVNDPNILRQVSIPVITADEANSIFVSLCDTLKRLNNGVGLSAIQIGIPKRVAAIRAMNGEFYSLINPIVVEKNEEITFFGEGCLSFPSVFVNTKRYKDFVIKNMQIYDGVLTEETQCFYYDNENNPRDIEAIAVQHEMDHMDGKILFDYEIKDVGQRVVSSNEVGRNDPCPCGSGKKYKKCCLS